MMVACVCRFPLANRVNITFEYFFLAQTRLTSTCKRRYHVFNHYLLGVESSHPKDFFCNDTNIYLLLISSFVV